MNTPKSTAKTIKRRQSSAASLAKLGGLPPILQHIYASRSVSSLDELGYGLAQMLDPNALKGLGEACRVLQNAIEQRSRLLIVGDFDADGATSSVLAVLALRAMGAASVDFLVPNRFEYGYGLTPEIVEVARGFDPDLIITVDNGISSIEGVNRANELGISVVVTDHHLAGRELPAAAAIVNPNQPGCSFTSKNLAGVGVIFYVLVALRAALRDCGWFTANQLKEPNLADYLDLVALGTVADVVPLDHNNRLLVEQGIQRIRAGRCRPGITALLEVAGRQATRLVASDLGFIVGPRLNAAGRLDDMSIGIRCLLAEDPFEARELASTLNELNQDRRAIESAMQAEALRHLSDLEINNIENAPWGLCVFQKDWHQGVVGILASRLKDRFHRPVIAFAETDDGSELKGSARSIPGLHIRDALDYVASQNPGLIRKFGGHAMAAGLSLARDRFQEFNTAFDVAVRKMLSAEALEEVILSDGELGSSELQLDIAHQIKQAGPWGQGFPEPVFDGEFILVQQRLLKDKHLKMVVAPKDHPQLTLDAIIFNLAEDLRPLSDATRLHLVYQLDVNEFRSRESVQLLVRDLWPI